MLITHLLLAWNLRMHGAVPPPFRLMLSSCGAPERSARNSPDAVVTLLSRGVFGCGLDEPRIVLRFQVEARGPSQSTQTVFGAHCVYTAAFLWSE
jgi:hypothetical protein